MLSFLRRKPRPASRRPTPSIRPRLEVLEDRCLLSAGGLDPTFGSGGVAQPATTIHGSVGGIAVYPNAGAATDGDVVAAGTSTTSNGSADDFAVVRYTKTGIPDSTFGKSGEVVTPFKTYANTQAQAVVIQSDGKIVAVGYAGQTKLPGNYAFALARYTTSGSLDKTFGNGGQVLTNFTPSPTNYFAQAYAAVLQPADGKIVVAGITNSGAYFAADNDIALARYNTNGSLDTTFGSGGKVITPHTAIPGSLVDPTGQYGQTEVISMALQSDGKVLVGGYTAVSSSSAEAFFARYNSTGTLDTTFGNNGVVALPAVPDNGNQNVNYSVGHLAVEPSGEIVVTGWGHQMALLHPDGSLDTSFGTNGMVATPFSGPVALEPNGAIVVMDTTQVARYVPSGALDPTFGTGGVVTVTLPSGATGGYNALAIQPDGKIDLAGGPASNAQAPTTLIVARLLPAEPQIGSFTASTNADGSVTLTASNVVALNPGSTITQVAFYLDTNGDGVLDTGDTLLGDGTYQASTNSWTFTFTPSAYGLVSGTTYTFFAVAADSYGITSDPLQTTDTVS